MYAYLHFPKTLKSHVNRKKALHLFEVFARVSIEQQQLYS